MKKVVLTGGGTAGHIMPNIALLPFLDDMDVHYVGSSGMEKNLMKNYGVTYHEIPCVKLVRGFNAANLKIPFILPKSIASARKTLGRIAPDVIFSKGGYVGLPVALAAPRTAALFLHESDMSAGLSNRLAYLKCDALFTAFDSIKFKKARHTGALLRREIYRGRKSRALEKFRTAVPGKPFVLIFGGSLGAKSLNGAVKTNKTALLERFNVIHITGRADAPEPETKGYYGVRFEENIYDFFALADVAVTRGGANSLCELMALKIPSLCVPLPKGASRGDQLENAAYFEKRGCLRVADDDAISGCLVPAVLDTLKNAPLLVNNMSRLKNIDGTASVAAAIKKAAFDMPRRNK